MDFDALAALHLHVWEAMARELAKTEKETATGKVFKEYYTQVVAKSSLQQLSQEVRHLRLRKPRKKEWKAGE
ncbi:MAG: hypothetical protein ACKPKO_22495, partial [Candidatus Fonsibacter sp.]